MGPGHCPLSRPKKDDYHILLFICPVRIYKRVYTIGPNKKARNKYQRPGDLTLFVNERRIIVRITRTINL